MWSESLALPANPATSCRCSRVGLFHLQGGLQVKTETLVDDDPEDSAYHEAGHAVVSCLLGMVFECVSVDPWPERPETGGFIHFPPRKLTNIQEVKNEIIQACAGSVGADLMPNRTREVPYFTIQEDIEQAQHFAFQISSDPYNLLNQCFQKARELLDTHLEALHRVAAALLKHRRL